MILSHLSAEERATNVRLRLAIPPPIRYKFQSATCARHVTVAPEVCETTLKSEARSLLVRGADHDGDPVVGTRPDTHFLGGFLLSLRLPRHLHRALRSGAGRRVLL